MENGKEGYPHLRFVGTGRRIPKYGFGNAQRLGNRKRPKRYQKATSNPVGTGTSLEENDLSSVGASNAITATGTSSTNLYELADDISDSESTTNVDDDHGAHVDEPDDEFPFTYGIPAEHREWALEASTTSHEIVLDTEIEHLYMMFLLQAKSFTNIDHTFNSFIIQDFDATRKQLLPKKFQFIERHYVKISKETTWILLCSCNENRNMFIKSLDSQAILEREALFRTLSSRYPDCIHVVAGKKLVPMIDKVHHINPLEMFEGAENEDHGYCKAEPLIQELILATGRLILVKMESSTAIVGIDREGFVCHSCKYGHHSCIHVSFLKDKVQNYDGNVPDFILELIATHKELSNTPVKTFIQRALSWNKFGWSTTPQQQAIYRLSKDNMQLVMDDGSMALIADNSPCDLCGASMDTATELDPNHKRLFLRSEIIIVKVHGRECGNCKLQRSYCGSSEGILNMRTFFIGHDVLRDYLHQFITGNSCSLIGYYERWKLNLSAAGANIADFLSYHQWRFSWYSFLDLLDVDYASGFTCDVCGQYPDILSCDATSLGFKKSFLMRSESLSASSSSHPLEGR